MDSPKQVKILPEQMDDYMSPRLSLSIHFSAHFSSFLVSAEPYWISMSHSYRQCVLRSLCVCCSLTSKTFAKGTGEMNLLIF